jgi:hypothetical protein
MSPHANNTPFFFLETNLVSFLALLGLLWFGFVFQDGDCGGYSYQECGERCD